MTSILDKELERLRKHLIPWKRSEFDLASGKMREITNFIDQPMIADQRNRARLLVLSMEFDTYARMINGAVDDKVLFSFTIGVKDNSVYMLGMDLAKGYNE
jgi:hypothetical protein